MNKCDVPPPHISLASSPTRQNFLAVQVNKLVRGIKYRAHQNYRRSQKLLGVVFFRVHVSIREMICIDTKIETLTWITRSRTLHNPSSGTGRLERISCSYSEEKRKKKKKKWTWHRWQPLVSVVLALPNNRASIKRSVTKCISLSLHCFDRILLTTIRT